jgi:hypothetical protein
MPARKDSQAEIIMVLNSREEVITVPTWEEDIELEPFYTRPLTSIEADTTKEAELWKVFLSWDSLHNDHYKMEVQEKYLDALETYKVSMPLTEDIEA